jgi:hypothetical protein
VSERAASPPPGSVKNAPLSPMAPWTSPFASGVATMALTEKEPADSPKIVTLPGSPPKAAMFFCTHLSAATWSSSPQLPDALRPLALVSSGCARKPNTPSRWFALTTTTPLRASHSPS